MTSLISVIIPAHNEASVIGRCLGALCDGYGADEIEIVVVCNGCSDDTAGVARGFGERVSVVETDVPSKTNALNLGDAAARAFPRIYLDADIVLTPRSLTLIEAALAQPPALAAAPRAESVFLPATQWAVRAYYRFWTALPYIRDGMIGTGAFALSREGRARFDIFPDVIADDGYVRSLFGPGERVQVDAAVSEVRVPATFGDLLKIKTRSRLGVLQLRKLYPTQMTQETRSKNYGRALGAIAARPALWLSAFPYVYIAVASWLRARRQMKQSGTYVWERDDSSRQPLVAKG
ncbi:glycosyltransferase family 2 protein [Phenylobacterium sp.]|uniref:glycosyltransferase n=1 Tax=Phenylobacterium sp. TaxID=1871053 RepID=UPI002F408AC8